MSQFTTKVIGPVTSGAIDRDGDTGIQTCTSDLPMTRVVSPVHGRNGNCVESAGWPPPHLTSGGLVTPANQVWTRPRTT